MLKHKMNLHAIKEFQLNCFKWNENDKILTILVKGGFLG